MKEIKKLNWKKSTDLTGKEKRIFIRSNNPYEQPYYLLSIELYTEGNRKAFLKNSKPFDWIPAEDIIKLIEDNS